MPYDVEPIVEEEGNVFMEKLYNPVVGIRILDNSMNLRELQIIIEKLLIVGFMPVSEYRPIFREFSLDFVLADLLEFDIDVVFASLSFHQEGEHAFFLLLVGHFIRVVENTGVENAWWQECCIGVHFLLGDRDVLIDHVQ